MTREDALRALRAIRERQMDRNTLQEDHEEADAILIRLIDDAEITRAFNEIDKWYA